MLTLTSSGDPTGADDSKTQSPLQLTTGNDCLIFQLLYFPTEFESDAKKLMDDYGLSVGNDVDLRGLAAEKLGDLRSGRNLG
uniref:Uncharacterized protein n=1 Tax=Salix viminalis TaxID=40686 RepID=A0A6N2M7I2_SALVM